MDRTEQLHTQHSKRPPVTWHLDPQRAAAEFRVRHFWGLTRVEGRFDRMQGTLTLADNEADVELLIDAESVNTGNHRRDTHLRSVDFFYVAAHPEVRFRAQGARLEGEHLKIEGELRAAGRELPLSLNAILRPLGYELEIMATAAVDHRQLGMEWSPLGIMRSPSMLRFCGWLTRAEGGPQAEPAPQDRARSDHAEPTMQRDYAHSASSI